MGDRTGFEANRDCDMVAGDQPARGGDQHREGRIARLGRREQHPHRVVLIKLRQAGRAVADREADLGNASNRAWGRGYRGGAQYPSAMPSLRGSEPPIRTPRSRSIQIAWQPPIGTSSIWISWPRRARSARTGSGTKCSTCSAP